ncbi:glycosyltransferase family 4 protein [Paenibacillus sp. SYP-B3998]|nr:glycosyltransferase family 4 protein [Paenibacillus sp. SYP-B3998]
MKNKVLLIYPHNFLERNMGTNNRVYEIAKFLKSSNFSIDLFSCKNFVSTTFDEFDKYNEEDIIDKLYLYDFTYTQNFTRKDKIKSKLLQMLSKLLKLDTPLKTLDNWVTPTMQMQYNEILMKNEYDFIVMFYVYTGELLRTADSKFKKIYFMEDLLSVGHYISGLSDEIGGPLNCEIDRLKQFDDIICISYDEKIFFEKILRNKNLHYLPHLINEKNNGIDTSQKTIDLLFIGYDNFYNIEGMQWFFKNVYPQLNSNINITIVGKVVEHIDLNYENVTKVGYIKDLDEIYSKTKISICPLLNGTGMKVKVIEAMSYGIPVVCTSRGVDGFPDKTRNGCIVSDNPAHFANLINQLFSDSVFYQSKSKEIMQYFKENLSMTQNISKLKDVFK